MLRRRKVRRIQRPFRKLPKRKTDLIEEFPEYLDKCIGIFMFKAERCLVLKDGMYFVNERLLNEAREEFGKNVVSFIKNSLKGKSKAEQARILEKIHDALSHANIEFETIEIPSNRLEIELAMRIPHIEFTKGTIAIKVLREEIEKLRDFSLVIFLTLPKKAREGFVVTPFGIGKMENHIEIMVEYVGELLENEIGKHTEKNPTKSELSAIKKRVSAKVVDLFKQTFESIPSKLRVTYLKEVKNSTQRIKQEWNKINLKESEGQHLLNDTFITVLNSIEKFARNRLNRV